MAPIRLVRYSWSPISSVTALFTILVLLILFVMLFASGCGSNQITVLGEKLSTTDAIQELVKDFEQSTGGKIKVKFVTADYVTMSRKAMDDLANKTAVYDIILEYNTALASYVQNNYVLTLEELKSPSFANRLGSEIQNRLNNIDQFDLMEKAWKEIGWYKTKDGKYQPVALPFAANTMLLCYNKSLFNDPVHKERYEATYREPLAVPTTWIQFENIAKYFSSQPRLYGIVLQGAAPYWIYFEWANLAFSMGGGVMRKPHGWDTDEKTPLLLTDSETVKATQLYARLRQYNASGDFFGTDNYIQRDRMKQGDVAMAIMWSDLLFDFVQGKERNSLDDRFAFAPIPGDKSMLAGGSAYINRRTKRPKEAVEFILWLLKPDVQAKLLARGLSSPVRTAYNDPEVKKLPYVDALRTSLGRGAYMLEAGPDADAIEVKLSNALQRMFKQKLEPEYVLQEVEQEIEVTRKNIFDELSKLKKRD